MRCSRHIGAALIVATQLMGNAFCQTSSSPTVREPALAQNGHTNPTAVANPADSLIAGAEIFENLTENSPELDATAFNELMTKFEKLRPVISAQLTPDRRMQLERLLTGLRKSWQHSDRGSMAVGSIEIYKLLQESMDPIHRSVPVEVPLLDYAGFKIKALLISKHPDWEQVRRTAHEATQWWASINQRVVDHSLRDAMDRTIVGINEASSMKDIRLLTFAAEMDLILVDGLESFFNSGPQNH